MIAVMTALKCHEGDLEKAISMNHFRMASIWCRKYP